MIIMGVTFTTKMIIGLVFTIIYLSVLVKFMLFVKNHDR